jgi:RNA polymerase sigma-70 factor, ECF subfamily
VAARRPEAAPLLSTASREKQAVEHDVERAFRRHYSEIYRFLRRRSESAGEAEELAQAVFAEAVSGLERLRPDGPPVLAWLYTVARRRAIDHARRNERTSRTLAQLEATRAVAVEPSYGPSVSAALRAALASLPELQRRVVAMKLLEDRSFAEIAARVGATEAACKMRFARGLEAVREDLRRRGVEP